MSIFDTLISCLPSPPDFSWDWAGLKNLASLEGLFDRMAHTPQDPIWHGEGDVMEHTRRVCEALAGMDAFRGMEERPRRALALAALLHDIGKITCTVTRDGAWVSPHHGPVGAQMARAMLWQDFGMCGSTEKQRFREAVCLLIRYHTAPLHLCEDEGGALRAVKMAADGELAPDFTLRSLCLLAEADALGRVAPDIPELMEKAELGRETAREEGCLDGPYPFASAHTRRALFSGTRVWKDQELYDDTWGEVILMCGLPGTGKDHWIRANCPSLPTVSLDDIRREMGIGPGDDQGRAVQAAKAQAKAFLRQKQPFVWNATSLTDKRAGQVDLFESYHARVRIVYLETSWEENLRRNAERPDRVPERVIQRMLQSLEPPETREAQAVEWICV